MLVLFGSGLPEPSRFLAQPGEERNEWSARRSDTWMVGFPVNGHTDAEGNVLQGSLETRLRVRLVNQNLIR